jgi:hypothetical protein
LFKTAFSGKDPYDWQVDVCEALLLGVDCIVIAGTGAGKMMPFAILLLMDKTLQKFTVVILPLNELENDQVCTVQSGPCFFFFIFSKAWQFKSIGLNSTLVNSDVWSNALQEVCP